MHDLWFKSDFLDFPFKIYSENNVTSNKKTCDVNHNTDKKLNQSKT